MEDRMKSFKNVQRKSKESPSSIGPRDSYPKFTINKNNPAFSLFSDKKAGQEVMLCVKCNVSSKRDSANEGDTYNNSVELEVLSGEIMKKKISGSDNPENKMRM
jgi:hypothetical protein